MMLAPNAGLLASVQPSEAEPLDPAEVPPLDSIIDWTPGPRRVFQRDMTTGETGWVTID